MVIVVMGSDGKHTKKNRLGINLMPRRLKLCYE